ncbi:hypothetical protein EZV62_003624 [Acer yangbiense]|uniref:F-box domain-containing protein n=1 Tax=Acer yangbiense TaxID=1000413 RepID=A0A5C7IHZ0_9ROSI|nr:hypothetical protein EZV62_003624 [Acer yangbiense]
MEITKAIDRISELPESILHNVMSFLTYKQVVQASVLCKTWLKAWLTYPVFEFEFEGKFYWLFDRRQNQKEFLETTLRHREKLKDKYMNKFTLDMEFYHLFDDPEFATIVERWIYHAVECNVKEFKLENEDSDMSWYFLPQIIYSAKSINMLELINCGLGIPKCKVELDFLRKLYLSDVYADNEVLQDVIAGCPMIEDLSLCRCRGIKNLELFNLAKLRVIKLWRNSELVRVSIEELDDVHSIVICPDQDNNIFCDIVINSCKSLKCLELSRTFIEDEWLRILITELPQLEYLRIEDCKLNSIRISSSSLKTLVIDRCKKVTAIEIETPNLGKITFVGRNVRNFSFNALALSEANIQIDNYNKVYDDHWYVQYIQLLEKFGHSKVLNIRSSTDQDVIIPGAVRQIRASWLFGVKHVNFISRPYMGSAISKILDGLLCIAPHAETISIELDNTNKSYFKFSYKNKIDCCARETATCYKSFPVSCWRHCIKEVEIENTKILLEKGFSIACCSNEGNIVERYVLRDEEIMEKISNLKGLSVRKENLLVAKAWLTLDMLSNIFPCHRTSEERPAPADSQH